MKRILIADDKATSRELLRTVLERQGYLVTEAADGGEALEKAKADTLDLILLDLQMPVRTGYEVLGELRQDPRYAGLPVIALTASAMPGDREKLWLRALRHTSQNRWRWRIFAPKSSGCSTQTFHHPSMALTEGLPASRTSSSCSAMHRGRF